MSTTLKGKVVAVFRWLFEVPDGYATLPHDAAKGSSSAVDYGEVTVGRDKVVPAVGNVAKFDTGSYMLSRI